MNVPNLFRLSIPSKQQDRLGADDANLVTVVFLVNHKHLLDFRHEIIVKPWECFLGDLHNSNKSLAA